MGNSEGGRKATVACSLSRRCLLTGLKSATSCSSGGSSVFGDDRRAGERNGDGSAEFDEVEAFSSSSCSYSNRLRFRLTLFIRGTSLPVTNLEMGTTVSAEGSGRGEVDGRDGFGSYMGSSPRRP